MGTEGQLVALAVGRVGFEDVYAAEHAPLVRLARVVLDDPAQAEDVVQDAFAQLHGRFSRVGNPEAYVRVTVLNGARRVNRRRRAAVRLGLAHVPAGRDGDAPPYLLDAVRRLPARQLEVIVLRFYLDLTVPEVAAVLRVPEGTVKSRCSRALASLRESFGDG
jgi:RNA polymerase sigma-70 factor (sigma-E family)